MTQDKILIARLVHVHRLWLVIVEKAHSVLLKEDFL